MTESESEPRAPEPRGRVAGAALAVGAGLLCGAPPLRDTDWGWHLATGRRILAERGVPWDDAFMWTTEGVRAPPVFWGFDLLLAVVDRLAGLPGLLALQALLVALVCGVTWALLVRARGLGVGWWPLGAGVIVCAASTTQALRLVLRPHVVSLLLGLVVVGLVLAARDRRRLLLGLPAVFLAWANLHPGVVLGLGLLGALVAGEALRLAVVPWRGPDARAPGAVEHVRLLALAFVLAAAATLVTPAGWELYPWLWEHRGMHALQGVTELAPFDPRQPLLRRALLVALLLGLLARPRDVRADPAPWFAAGFFALLTVQTSRFFVDTLSLLAVAAAGPRGVVFPATRARRLGLALLVVAAASGVWREATLRLAVPALLHPAYHAPEAAEFLLEHPTPDPIYNSNRLGGDLVHRLQGRRRLFWDGRQPLYVHLAGASFDELDERFRFGTLVLAERDPPLRPELPGQTSRFRLVYFDDEARIYVDASRPLGRPPLEHMWFEWTPTGARAYDLWLHVDAADPRGALAELEARRDRPGGYYVLTGLAAAHLALGDREAAHACAAQALEVRDGSQARSLLRASGGDPAPTGR